MLLAIIGWMTQEVHVQRQVRSTYDRHSEHYGLII